MPDQPGARVAALMDGAYALRGMAKRLRDKAQETGNKTHYGTAAGLSLGAVKLIEMADAERPATGEDHRA